MQAVKKIFLSLLGVLLIIAGVIGSFLPIIPGFALILLGLTVMGKEAMVLDPIKKWLEKRRASKN